MPRHKSYDRDEALELACRAFWEHGYQALGVRELEQLTGLNKFAIRSEFGGKEGLYLEALNFYTNAALETGLGPLRDGGVDAIVRFLEGLVAEGSDMSSPWGCLMVNTGVENLRVRSDLLAQATNHYWQTLETHLLTALRNAQAQGELARSLAVDDLAKGMVSAVMGVHAQNRTSQAHSGGQHLVRLLTDHLRSLVQHHG